MHCTDMLKKPLGMFQLSGNSVKTDNITSVLHIHCRYTTNKHLHRKYTPEIPVCLHDETSAYVFTSMYVAQQRVLWHIKVIASNPITNTNYLVITWPCANDKFDTGSAEASLNYTPVNLQVDRFNKQISTKTATPCVMSARLGTGQDEMGTSLAGLSLIR